MSNQSDLRNLTRNQLASFLPNPRLVKAFETLVTQVAAVDAGTGTLSDTVNALLVEIGNATATANSAEAEALRLSGGMGKDPAVAVQEAIATLRAELQNVGADHLAPEIDRLRKDMQALSLMPPPQQYRRTRYGGFYDTTTQTAAAINTAYPITMNGSESYNYGVALGSPTSRVYFDTYNLYDIQFSLQLNKTSASAANVWIWARRNGADVANSATVVTLQGSSAAAVAAWNFVMPFNAGDYFELVWATSDTGCRIEAAPASGIIPAIPSIIMTVTDNIIAQGA